MHKLVVEIDENGHTDRPKLKEKKREEINPDKENFDIFDETREIQDFIYESGVKLSEQLEKDKFVEDLGRSVKTLKLSG